MGDSSFFTACIDKYRRHFMQIPSTLCSSYSCYHLLWSALPFWLGYFSLRKDFVLRHRHIFILILLHLIMGDESGVFIMLCAPENRYCYVSECRTLYQLMFIRLLTWWRRILDFLHRQLSPSSHSSVPAQTVLCLFWWHFVCLHSSRQLLLHTHWYWWRTFLPLQSFQLLWRYCRGHQWNHWRWRNVQPDRLYL